jgi:hypothetical protein
VTGATCGNSLHPDGAWHEASPLATRWQWGKQFRQMLNRELWGCRCDKGKRGEQDDPRLGMVRPTNERQQVLGTCSPESRWTTLKASLREFLVPQPWPEPAKDETTPTVIADWIERHRHNDGCDGTDDCGCVS